MKRAIDDVTRNRAKKLRRNMTIAEKSMWNILRNRQLNRFRFRRQHPIPPYIVDFICLSKKFIIELDGEEHNLQKEYDERRTKYLERRGYRVHRISNSKFFKSGDELTDELINLLSR